MAVGTDDAVVTDAFFSATLGGGVESRISAGSTFFVNVDVEAGTSAIAHGDAYNILVLLQNITNFSNDVIASFSGNLGPAVGAGTLTFSSLGGTLLSAVHAWNTANTDFTFGFSATAPAAGTTTIYKILAIVALGTAETNVETFESELILVK